LASLDPPGRHPCDPARLPCHQGAPPVTQYRGHVLLTPRAAWPRPRINSSPMESGVPHSDEAIDLAFEHSIGQVRHARPSTGAVPKAVDATSFAVAVLDPSRRSPRNSPRTARRDMFWMRRVRAWPLPRPRNRFFKYTPRRGPARSSLAGGMRLANWPTWTVVMHSGHTGLASVVLQGAVV